MKPLVMLLLAIVLTAALTKASSSHSTPISAICRTAEITIFSCMGQGGEAVGICLSPTAKLSLLTKIKHGPLQVQNILRADENVSDGSPHGANVVLQLVSTSHKTTLFVGLDSYDMDSGTFEIDNSPQLMKRCLRDTDRRDSGVVMLKGVLTNVGLPRLGQVGLAQELANPPKWPGT